MKQFWFSLVFLFFFQGAIAQTTAKDSAHLEIDREFEEVAAILEASSDSTLGIVDEYVFNVPYFENTTRKIRVYRPANFTAVSRYPVIFMHDGQNLFEDSTSFVGEWHVDEVLDSLRKQVGVNCIVVGIDNIGEKRMQEYNPFDNERFGKGYGVEYVDWLVNHLIPRIDSMYPTSKSPATRTIMGSSMGGLISHYALLKYPDVFGAAGIFSPSYWICDEDLSRFENQFALQAHQKVYILAGGKEGRNMKKLTKKHKKILEKQQPTSKVIKRVYDKNGEHNERFWTAYLADAFVFLLAGYR